MISATVVAWESIGLVQGMQPRERKRLPSRAKYKGQISIASRSMYSQMFNSVHPRSGWMRTWVSSSKSVLNWSHSSGGWSL